MGKTKNSFEIPILLVALMVSLVAFSDTSEIKISRAQIPNQDDKHRNDAEKSGSAGSDWPMHQYNAQHTGYNDYSTISLPLGLRWSLHDTIVEVSPVTVVGDRALITYAHEGQFRLACLDIENGSVLWMWYLGGGNDIWQPSYGNGNVYVQRMYHSNSFIAAFDLISGDSLWLTKFSAQWDSYLAPTVHEGRVLYGAGTYGGVWCNDAYTGQILWKLLGTDSEWFTPAAYKDTVYVFTEDYFWVGNLHSLSTFWNIRMDTIRTKIYDRNEATGVIQMGVAPVIDTVNKIAYCMDAFWHDLYAIDLDQRSFLWIDSLVPHGYGKSPAMCGDYLYVTHWGYLQTYNRFTGEKLWTFAGDDSLRYAPVIANGYLFVGSLRNTYALDLNTHQVVWTYPVGGWLTVSDKYLFVSDSLWHNLYAFGDFTTDVEDESEIPLPKDFVLNQNYPNPFNPSTSIDFSILSRCNVEIIVYNTIGQTVKTLTEKIYSAGSHSVTWDGTDNSGNEVPSGVYFYKMIAGDFVESKKMVLVR
jgi:hypothetical protein